MWYRCQVASRGPTPSSVTVGVKHTTHQDDNDKDFSNSEDDDDDGNDDNDNEVDEQEEEEDDNNDKRNVKKSNVNVLGRWSEEEKKLLTRGIQKYGTAWTSVSEYVGTRTSKQCKSHHYTNKKKLIEDDEEGKSRKKN